MASIQWRGEKEEYAHLVDHKNGVYKSLGKLTKAEAQAYLANYARNVLFGEAGIPNPKAKYEDVKKEVLAHYERHQPSTKKKYEYAFRSLEKSISPYLVAQVNVKAVETWTHHAFQNQNLSDTSVHMHYRHLKSAWNKAIKWGYASKNPFTEADKPVVQKKVRRYLSDEEVDRLLAAARGCDCEDAELMAAVFVGCGLRLQELTHQRWCDTDLNRRTFTIRAWGDWKIKTHDERIVYMPEEVAHMLRLRKTRATSELVFPSPRGGGIRCMFAIDRLFNSLYRRANILGAKGVHVLRHTYGYRGAKGGNIVALQHSMGHKDIATTMIYAHTDDQQKKALADQSPRLNLGDKKKEQKAQENGGLSVV